MTNLRQKGYQSIIYLDDFLFLGSSIDECRSNINASIILLQSLGFIINYSKSCLVPATKCKYLGFIFDSRDQSIAIPSQRRTKLLKLTRNVARRTTCSIREFASFIGSLISVCPAVQYGLLYTKGFERKKILSLAKYNEDYTATMEILLHLQRDFLW